MLTLMKPILMCTQFANSHIFIYAPFVLRLTAHTRTQNDLIYDRMQSVPFRPNGLNLL